MAAEKYKSQIRKEALQRRDAIPADVRAFFSERIAQRLTATRFYAEAEMILIYLSYKSEVETTAIVRAALRDGKKVYAPRVVQDGENADASVCEGREVNAPQRTESRGRCGGVAETTGSSGLRPRLSGRMEFYRIVAEDELSALPRSPLGIAEPAADAARLFSPEKWERTAQGPDACLVVMPGTAFDEARGRIGYAGGFYDRYLRRFAKRRTAALAFEAQLTARVPVEAHDVRPDCIVTEERVLGEMT